MDEEEQDRQWFNRAVAASRLPATSRAEQRFATYRPRNESQQKLLEAAEAFARGELKPPLLLLYGTTGLGKTHLAWAVGWEYIESGERVYYYQAEELLDDLRAATGDQRYDGKIKALRKVDLLIVDDLGAQSDGTGWGVAKLDMLLDFRYRERLPTIITTNTLEIPPRILDRFCEGTVVGVKGESYRKEKKHGEKTTE